MTIQEKKRLGLVIFLGASSAMLIPYGASAQSAEQTPPPWQRSQVSYGAGVGLGWGPFATDSGPWVDAFGVVETPLARWLYLRAEPGLTYGWTSDSGVMMIQNRAVQNDETFRAFGFMARGLIGADLSDWLTLRLGGVAGYLVGSFESSVCPSESYSRGQYGATAQAALRFGPSRGIEVGIQAEGLAKFANPRCRPRPDPSLPPESRYSSPYLVTTEASRGSLGFLSARMSYVWF